MEWFCSVRRSFVEDLNACFGVEYDIVLGVVRDPQIHKYWVIDEIRQTRLIGFTFETLLKDYFGCIVLVELALCLKEL